MPTPEEQRLTDLVAQHVRTIKELTGEGGFPATRKVFLDVFEERKRQEQLKAQGKFAWTCADAAPNVEKLAVLTEETGEVAHEVTDEMIRDSKRAPNRLERNCTLVKIREELVQVAAVAVAWCEAIDDEMGR